MEDHATPQVYNDVAKDIRGHHLQLPPTPTNAIDIDWVEKE